MLPRAPPVWHIPMDVTVKAIMEMAMVMETVMAMAIIRKPSRL
jgi:hypothetical protein